MTRRERAAAALADGAHQRARIRVAAQGQRHNDHLQLAALALDAVDRAAHYRQALEAALDEANAAASDRDVALRELARTRAACRCEAAS